MPRTEKRAEKRIKSRSGRRDRNATMQALRDAAMAVFAKRGYDAATTKEIATQAAVNEALIQRYFGGKAGLLRSILSTSENTNCGVQSTACAAVDLPSLLAGFFDQTCQQAVDNQAFMRVVVSRAIIDGKIGATLYEQVFDVFQKSVIEQLNAMRAQGKLAADIAVAPLAYGLTILAFSLGFFGRLVYRTDERELQSVIREITTVLSRGMAP